MLNVTIFTNIKKEILKFLIILIKNGFFTATIKHRAELSIQYIKNNIFSKSPTHPYRGWYGQGYTGDMMILDGRSNDNWHKARQYYWLQTECKVERK